MHIKQVFFLLIGILISANSLFGQIPYQVNFSHPPGFYHTEFTVALSGFDSIYYSVNGTDPNTSSPLYNAPIVIEKSFANSASTIQSTHLPYADYWPNDEFGFQPPKGDLRKVITLKARGVQNGILSDDIYESKYFINSKKHTISTFCIDADSLALFDFDSGIYVPGQFWEEENANWSGNYFQRGDAWEKRASVTFFDENGSQQFSTEVGIRISGNASRRKPQKSFKLYFRNEYWQNEVPNLFFPDRPIETYKRLILRTPFTYWYWSGGRNLLFQDALIHRIVWESNANLDVSLSKPASIYINGEYWGIQNIRETHDKFFLEKLTGADRDDINIVDGTTLIARDGDASQFANLMDFVKSNDLTNSENYAYVASKIDVANYIDYYVMQTYFGNKDWPVNNHLVWNIQSESSPFRWFFFDLDGALDELDLDPFQFMENENENTTVLFRKLMENDAFNQRFLARYVRHLNNGLKPSRVSKILDEFVALYAPEVESHIGRWNNPIDYNQWYSSCISAHRFFEQRGCYIKSFLINRFGDSKLSEFDCNYSNEQTGFAIYPNPASTKIIVAFKNTNVLNQQLSILNNIGTLVKEVNVRYLKQEIDVSELSQGVYFVRISLKNEVLIEKLIIN